MGLLLTMLVMMSMASEPMEDKQLMLELKVPKDLKVPNHLDKPVNTPMPTKLLAVTTMLLHFSLPLTVPRPLLNKPVVNTVLLEALDLLKDHKDPKVLMPLPIKLLALMALAPTKLVMFSVKMVPTTTLLLNTLLLQSGVAGATAMVASAMEALATEASATDSVAWALVAGDTLLHFMVMVLAMDTIKISTNDLHHQKKKN